jgi:hypothetical protein
MSYRSAVLALALAAAAPAPSFAQAPAPTAANPYRVLYVVRETVKPGKGGAHDKLESEWAKGLTAARMPFGILALSAITGPRETWFVSGFPSFADYARLSSTLGEVPALAATMARLDPQEGDLLSDARGMLLVRRDDLSYGTSNLPTMRFMTISRISVRPGHVSEFEDARKTIKAAHETARLADSYAVYQATSGVPAGTFYIFVSRKTLGELDAGEALHGTPEYVAALGGDDGRRKMAAAAGNYLNGSQTDQFAFVPSQSIVTAAWAAADPGYWKLRTTPSAP